MFRRKGRLRRAAAAGLCAWMALQNPAMTAHAELPEQLTVTDGQFIRVNGTAVEGALAKGVTISKYQNKAGDIDWNQV